MSRAPERMTTAAISGVVVRPQSVVARLTQRLNQLDGGVKKGIDLDFIIGVFPGRGSE